jgi:cytochrome c-type biogenesis protein CcmH
MPARPTWRLLGGLAGFVLAFGVAGYAWLGNPAALAVSPGNPAPAAAEADGETSKAQFEAMTTRLAERLKTQPEDAEGWSMLGRSYSVLERYPEAVQAYQRALALRPKEAQIYADLADAQGMVNGRKLDGEPEKLVARALELDPDNTKALGLAGTVAFDRGDAAGAARYWERALLKVEPGSELAGRLQAAVDEARQRAGLPPLPRAAAVAAAPGGAGPSAPLPADHPPVGQSAPTQASAAAAVQVRVTLAPALAAKASPEDTVFVFARAQQGPKAPLAIQRRQVKDLPLELTLDDSMAMSPALRLSTVPQVVVGARISKSGNAMPQSGDLQGLSPVVAVGTRGLQLQITDVLP